MRAMALMEFVSARGDFASEVERLIQDRHRLASRLLVPFVLADQMLEMLREEPIDRRVPLGRQDLGLTERLTIQTDDHILFRGVGEAHNIFAHRRVLPCL
jgi:hypothetical protein